MTQDENVTPFKVVTGITRDTSDEAGIVGYIKSFLAENELLDDFDEAVVELEAAASDESRLGRLNEFEKNMFIIATIMQDVAEQEAKNLEADNLEKITAIMRAKAMTFNEAMAHFVQNNSDANDALLPIRQAVVTRATAGSLYEFSVRSRFNCWSSNLIVRYGFIVYSYG
jgi:hypothetical protein